MNAERLLQHFDRIAEAPDVIPRLRRFILDLAVRGKLVEQDPSDKPAEELLKLVRKGVAARTVPVGWISVAFGSLLDMQYGKGLPATDRKEQGDIPVFGSNGIVGFTDSALTDKAAIIIGRKGSAGALNLCDGPSWTTDVAYFLVPPDYFDIRFLLFTLGTLDLGALGKGVKPGLSRSDAYQLSLAIPPLAEQYCIVAKVDELMALCDQLEAAKTEREQSRDRLVAASLHRLNQPADTAEADAPDAFHNHARFTFQHLPRLTTRPAHIKQLRQTILNLAVHGQLVPQDPNDEPAERLLEKMTSERNAKKILDSVTKFDADVFRKTSESLRLPDDWALAPLVNIALTIVDCPHSTPKWIPAGILCVRTNQFRPGFLDLSDSRFVSEATFLERIQRLKPIEGDILYSREGGILGVACRVPPNAELCLGQRMMLIRPPSDINSAFLEMLLNSPLITEIAREKTTGGAAPRVNVATVKAYPIPLPPLAEQHRIVAKVDKLMALSDQLEAQLTTTEADSRRLLEAVLHEALNGCIQVT